MNFLFLLFFLCSCESSQSLTSFSGNAMTIDYRVQIGHPLSSRDIANVEKIIASAFHEVNDIHNKWNPNSEISRLNRLQAFEKAPLSPELFSLLQLADRIHRLSYGRFDPTIEPLQQLWKTKITPNPSDIEKITPSIGWSKVHFDESGFWKEHELTMLDLCGIAKGHLVDLLLERLVSAGYLNSYVEWGGEIRAHGEHPLGRPWTIFISQLGDFDPSRAIATVELRNQAIATSGDYEQYWEFAGKRYFHVMNPLTLAPLESKEHSIASASVEAPCCALADGLATAALFFENESAAKAWLDEVSQKLNLPLKYWIKTN